MAETQGALTLVLRIRSKDERRALEAKLAKIGRQIRDGIDSERKRALLPMRDARTIHYARLVIVPEARGLPASLVLSTNFDEPREAHVEELRQQLGPALDDLFSHTEEYASGTFENRGRWRELVESQSKPYGAFHIAKRFYSVREIEREQRLRDRIEDFLDTRSSWEGRNVLEEVRDFVQGESKLSWALDEPPPEPTEAWRAEHKRTSIARGFVVVPRLLLGALLLPWLRLLEMRDTGRYDDVSANESDWRRRRWELARIRDFADQEDRHVTNQLTTLSTIKPGLARRFYLGAVFQAIDWLANIIFYRGHLGGIPSIHFARWVILDRGRRLLFFSNYDGSWENYLGDFIDQASSGLTGVWSNTELFPPTRFLTEDGADDEQAFKRWARHQQLETDVWYAAYPDTSVQNVIKNALIRRGLYELDPADEEKWLRLF